MKGKEKNVSRRGWKTAGLPVFFCSLFTGVAVWLLATILWEKQRWSDLKLEEIIGQLATGMEGSSRMLVMEHIVYCILPGLAAALLAAVLLLRIPPEKQRQLARRACLMGSGGLTVVLVYACVTLNVVSYAMNTMTDSTYIEDNYVDPAQVELTFPEQKRNLICIWLESMESSYADTMNGGAFAENRISALTRLAEENENFTGVQGGVNGGYSASGATWTAGALFAQTSGLPLKIPIANSSMSEQDTFFPGVTTLGDILHDAGYQQALLIGSDATFGGRRLYFTEHGGYTMWDYNYSRETGQIPADYRVWWGYEDEKLFAFAKQHLLDLAASGQPFNLSMLTVDTHFPDGYPCALCGDAFADQYSNVIACSDQQVASFVAWIQQQPFYENTTIVIAGDHVTMDVDYSEAIGTDYPRRTYFTIINPAAEVENPVLYRSFTTMDHFPTMLAALGVEIAGDRLGLGVNLFSDEPTLLERDGLDTLNSELQRKSDFMNRLSGISEQVYERSSTFGALDTGLEIAFDTDTLTYTVHNLEQIEADFSQIEIYADIMNGEVKITMWSQVLEKQPDGSYQATMPLAELEGLESFTVHIYATTVDGRIKVDSDYICNVSSQTLTR